LDSECNSKNENEILVQNKNLISKQPQKENINLKDISENNNQKINESSADIIDDSGYSETVIDLVHVIQLYIYDKSNAINKLNFLLRVFNRWRNICNRSSSKREINIHDTSTTSVQKRIEFIPDIRTIITESTPKLEIVRQKNNVLLSQDLYAVDNESLIVCASAKQPPQRKQRNCIQIYSNYMNNLTNKLETFMKRIETFCLKGFIVHMRKKQRSCNKKAAFAQEDEFYIYISENLKDAYNENKNDLKDSTEIISKSREKSKKTINKKKRSTYKALTKLEVFSFDFNLSASINYNYIPASFINSSSYMLAEEKNINKNHSLNIHINNKSTCNFEGTNNLRRNVTFNNNNLSFSPSRYLNTGINHSVTYSKNATFNSELRSEEEPDEINEVRISSVIQIQNLWREYRIQKYLLNYAKKLKFVDRFIKRKNIKLKSILSICYSRWKKTLFKIKIDKAVKIIQKFYREMIFMKRRIGTK